MIVKLNKNSTEFYSTLKYCLEKADADILLAHGVRIGDPRFLARQFAFIARNNYRVIKPRLHLVLAFPKSLRECLTKHKLAAIAKEFISRVELEDYPYVVVRHQDTSHPHLHLIFSRVGYCNKTLSNHLLFFKSIEARKEMRKKYYLHPDGEHTPISDTKNKFYRKKREIKYYVEQAVYKQGPENNWEDIEEFLIRQGITLRFKRDREDGILGVSFGKEGFNFSGSKLGERYGYYSINKFLNGLLASQEFQLENAIKQSFGSRASDGSSSLHLYKDPEKERLEQSDLEVNLGYNR